MNRTLVIAFLGVAFVVGGVMRADAAGTSSTPKIGYVDLQRTLNETAAGKKAKARLEADKTRKQKELDKKQKELQNFAAELDKQRVVLKPNVLRQREQELQQKYVNLQQRYFQLQQELQKQENTLIQRIFGKAYPAIKVIAKQGGYTMILEKSSVLWAADGLDITDQVNKRL